MQRGCVAFDTISRVVQSWLGSVSIEHSHTMPEGAARPAICLYTIMRKNINNFGFGGWKNGKFDKLYLKILINMLFLSEM